MAERLTVEVDKKPAYDIVFEASFDALGGELEQFDLKERKICIITDSNVEKLYGACVQSLVAEHCRECVLFSFPAGEESKNLETVQKAYEFLIAHGFDRKDLLLALGGGVVGDLTGFVAATYLRGVAFIQVPTTLLAQVDSSIGGKTGVDFKSYKNMVGAFKMPKLVYMNLSVLKDLDDRQYFAGMAEVLKHGLIKDGAYYEWLIDHFVEIGDREIDIITEMVKRSCIIKKNVVEKDPTEQGERALLNFGHTIGHAIEKQMDFAYLHGECVALGMVCAAYISWKREMLSMEEYYEIRDMFVPFQLPISTYKIDPEKVLEYTKNDKKMDAGKIKFILLKKVGRAVIDTSVTAEEMRNAISEIYYKEEELYD
ncbi:MAG: 3-dehydroquinate synthase [Lachnospiraceae bacterium]|nr:3-dehydroquinate synthase [Lachnospiraceae bacterium]